MTDGANQPLLASLRQSLRPTKVLCHGTAVTLRPVTPGDYKTVRALVPEVSRCHKTYTEAEFAELLSSLPTYHPCCAVRCDTGELVGFAELIRLPHVGRNFDGRLERVVVSETFRNRGLATAMCDHLIMQAKDVLDCGRVELTVEKENARHIYENKLGFCPVSTTVMRRMLFKSPAETEPAPQPQ